MNKQIYGIRLCYENAKHLTREAKILYWIGSNARSISIAVLSFEELSKVELIARELILNDKEIDKVFKEQFVNHKFKQYQGYFTYLGLQYLKKGRDYIKKIFDEIRNLQDNKEMIDFDKLKLQGFYVDIENDNFVSPKRLTRRKARDMIRCVNESVCAYRPFMRNEEKIKQFLRLYKESKPLPESETWKDFIDIVRPKNKQKST